MTINVYEKDSKAVNDIWNMCNEGKLNYMKFIPKTNNPIPPIKGIITLSTKFSLYFLKYLWF